MRLGLEGTEYTGIGGYSLKLSLRSLNNNFKLKKELKTLSELGLAIRSLGSREAPLTQQWYRNEFLKLKFEAAPVKRELNQKTPHLW